MPALAQDTIPPAGAAQIQALLMEKLNRTPAQRKMDSQILYNARLAAGRPMAPGLRESFRPSVLEKSAGGLIHVDIDADVNNDLLSQIRALGGRVESAFPQYKSVRAWIPLRAAETLAERDDVHFVKPAEYGRTNPIALPSARQANILAQLARALPGVDAVEPGTNGGAIPNLGSSSGPGPDTDGVKAHGADLVHTAGIYGAGLKVGVLSDGVTSLANEQAANRLPAVTVIAGQSGDGPGPCPSTPMVSPPTCPDEGTALLEVVYSMAPAAQLYYATANSGEGQFAANILALQAAGCNIIVDDVTYGDEPVFQDGTVAQAVNTVTAAGVMYFSSAANSGNLDSGQSGTWEGDFNASGSSVSFPDPRTGIIHSFGATNYEVLTAKGGYYAIQWSDPYGGASDDYDLYILDPTGTTVEAFSNNTQSGSQPPYESIKDSAGIVAGSQIVIVKVSGATRALHLDTGRGRVSIGTAGNTFGHNAAASGFTVAAVDVATAGGGIFTGGTANPPESFSSDGPRKIFFTPSGTAITPGNFLFGTNGGTTLAKVDFTAADGVITGVPQFPSFFGTSAAAPHAAGIAALIKSAKPSLTPAQIKSILYSTSLNVSNFLPRTVGSGIVMANLGVAAVIAAPNITKTFFAPTIPLFGSTSLSFSLTNPAANSVSVSGIGFTDTLPPGLVVSSPSGLAGSCGGGTIAATPGSGSVTLTGATLAPGAVCNFSLNVTGIVAGVQINSVTVFSPLGNGNTANASVTVVAPPSINKTFAPDKFIPGGTTTVSFSIANPNSTVTLLGVAFIDSLPSGLVVASPSGLTSNCIGGTAAASAGTISLSFASIAPLGNCTVSASVTAPEGIYDNSVQVTSSNGGVGNTSTARVYVATPPNLSKVFGELSIGSGGSTTLTFTLMNPNHVVTLDALHFSDTLPAGLVISTPNGLVGSCGGGTITAAAATTLVLLSGATLLPQAACTFTINVASDGAASGYLINSTSTVTSTEALPGAAASATIFIGNPLQIAYAANPTAGETPVNITNSGASAGGNICVSVYTLLPSAQMVSCCSCQAAPNSLVTLGVNKDLTNNAVNTSVVIKLVATTPGGTCAASAGTQGSLANGMVAYLTSLQAVGNTNTYNAVNQPFVSSTLSAAEYAQLANTCSANFGGGTFCGSCNPAPRP